MKVFGMSDIGLLRVRNEDSYLIDEERKLFVICDGMGGHKAGDVASNMAIDIIKEKVVFNTKEEVIPALISSIQEANTAIFVQGRSDFNLYEMGTTITAAVIDNGELTVAHVGDSALFIIRNHDIHKVTRDHTLAEQMKSEELRKEDFKLNAYNHILTRALGVEPKVDIDIFTEEIAEGDLILLCTDGLTDLLKENDILNLLKYKDDIRAFGRLLIDTALEKGGHDNITIILISV